MPDLVRPLKIETPVEGGTQTDMIPTEVNPAQDYVNSKGLALEVAAVSQISSASNIMSFVDTQTSSTLLQLRTAVNNTFNNSTNGYVATNVQAAIEESGKHLATLEASATANATTTSGTDALLTGMTLTPVAGTYLVLFSSSITCNQAGSACSGSYYVGGVQKADSLRKISPFDGGTLSVADARGIMQINGIVTVNGSQAIEVRWSVSGGTATCGPRTLNTMRVG